MDEKKSECDVCLENVCQGHNLQCGHLCCIKCIKESIKIDENGFCECPRCFKSIPSDGIETLIHTEQTKKVKGCSICMHKKVVIFCEDCNHYYCLKCSLIHSKIPSTKFHLSEKLLLGNGNKGDELAEDAENVNVYCGDCKEVISLKVYASQHKKHEMQLMTDFTKYKKIEMDKEIAIKNCKFSEIEFGFHRIALQLLKCENLTDEMKMLVDERTKLLKNIIDSNAKKTCKEIDEKAHSYVKKAFALKLQLNKLKHTLEKETTKSEKAAGNAKCINDKSFDIWPLTCTLEEFNLSFTWNSKNDEAKILEMFGSLNTGFSFGLSKGDVSERSLSFDPSFFGGPAKGAMAEKDFSDFKTEFTLGMPKSDVQEKGVPTPTPSFSFGSQVLPQFQEQISTRVQEDTNKLKEN